MVEVERLIPPDDNFCSLFPGLGFRDVYSLVTAGEPVLVTDPIYVADVYNSTDEPSLFLKNRGVFIGNFGGDIRCPIWCQPPFLILPISNCDPDDAEPPEGIEVLAEDIHCDSGSLVFLPMTGDLPEKLSRSIEQVLHDHNGVVLNIPGGKWVFYYEQFPAPSQQLAGLFRNVVVQHESGI